MEVSEEDDLRTRRSLPAVDADSRASDKSEPPLRRRDGLRVRGGARQRDGKRRTRRKQVGGG